MRRLYAGESAPVVRIDTFLCLTSRSMAASAASDREGPPMMTSAFFARISRSTASNASERGAPGSRSRVSRTSRRRGR